MKDSTIFNIGISLLTIAVIVSNVAQIEALTVEETCQIVKNGSFIGDPADCQNWVYCLNGQPIYGKCGPGYLFNSASGICDYTDRVACNKNLTTMCTGVDLQFRADPFDCTKYCYCQNSVTTCESCPTGQYFVLNPPSCQWIDSDSTACQVNAPCLLVKDGFIKDPTSCAGWIRCANGAVVGGDNCPNNLLFNVNEGICDYAVNVDCTADSGGSTTTPAPPQDVCTGVTAKGFVSDQESCTGYFYCATAGDTKPIWGKCPKGSNFLENDTDETKSICTDPYQVPCKFNRCDGVSNLFMTAPTDDAQCSEYYYCNNGQPGAAQPCPVDYYFNEETQVCQSTEVDFPICGSIPV